MAITYKKMWKLLVDKNMSQADLRKAAHIAPNTMTKLKKDEYVYFDVLSRVCNILDCDYGDIIEYIPDKEQVD